MKYILLLILSTNFAFAQVNLQTVAYQFLNIHGANWQDLAKTSDDWLEIRSIHEQIISQPQILEDIFPQPNMVEYLHPIAIHSYGKLIGDGHIPLDDSAKDILNKLKLDINLSSESKSNATIEALRLTNTPWGLEELLTLFQEDDPNRNHQIFKQIGLMMKYDEDSGIKDFAIDTDYKIAKIDFSKDTENWQKQIYKLRKMSSDYLRKNPQYKNKPAFLKLVQNSQKAAKEIEHFIKKQKKEQSVVFNRKDNGETINKLEVITQSNRKKLTRSVASSANKKAFSGSFISWLIALACIFVMVLVIYKKTRK